MNCIAEAGTPACRGARFGNSSSCHAAYGSPRLSGRLPGEEQSQGNHERTEPEMQPVIRVIQGNEVGCTVEISDQPVDPQDQIDDSAADEVAAGSRHGPSHQVAGDTEEQMQALCRYETWKIPSNLASESWPAPESDA